MRPGYRTLLCLAIAIGGSADVFGGTWTPLAHTAPGPVNLMLILSDGTIMAANDRDTDLGGGVIGNAWYRLTPDSSGSYVNGTWSSLTSAHDTRLYYSSAVLMDGRVFVAGGEFGSGGPKAEVYDPLTNLWTQTNPPTSLLNPASNSFYDSDCKILPNGSVLIAPVFPHVSGQPLIYNPATNTWSAGGHYVRGSYQDEASWVKLPDDSILTIDPFGTHSERYIPATNSWVDDAIVPVPLYDPFGSELGAAFLLPSGKAFFLGSTGHTAIYTPTGTASPGSWVAGPDIPGAHGTPDAPAAMMSNGKILCAVSPVPTSADHFPPPTSFYEYDPVANSLASISGPTGPTINEPCYPSSMVDLPDGNVLYSHMTAQLYVYQPDGPPLAAGKPAITSISANGDGSYHLIGTGLNGISEGAAYGDDLQMDSNYPLVRFSDGMGNISYGRTYNWSRTSVQTGAAPVTTEFRLPAALPVGRYSMVVVANGIASDPVTFNNCVVAGDINFDGVLNGLDIQPFVNCLLSGACYGCGDFTGGGLSEGDVSAFVAALLTP
ncbi:MAG TPA: kelch repeat-containing protein [Phycisphaerae bacterium]|nr:kelch repeat-containing protein [Phycisphaerae bacterium]